MSTTNGFGRVTNIPVPQGTSVAVALQEIDEVAHRATLPDGVVLTGVVGEDLDEGEYAANVRFDVDELVAANPEAAIGTATRYVYEALRTHFTGR